MSEAYVSTGYIKLNYEWDWAGAAAAFEKALALSPRLPEAHHAYGYYLYIMHRPNEALAEMQRAWELDPLSPFFVSEVGNAYRWTGDSNHAIEWHQRALQLDPQFFSAYSDLAYTLLDLGRPDLAIGELEKGIALSNGDQTAVDPLDLAIVLARAGRTDRARRVLAERRSKSMHLTQVAAAQANLGLLNEAFESLEIAMRQRDSALIFLLVNRSFAPLWKDPRCADLARRIGLPS